MFKSFTSDLNLTSWLTADEPWRRRLAWNNDLSCLYLSFLPAGLFPPFPTPASQHPFRLSSLFRSRLGLHASSLVPSPLLTGSSLSAPSLLMTLGSSGRSGHQITTSLINIFGVHAPVCFCCVCVRTFKAYLGGITEHWAFNTLAKGV